MAVTSAAVVAVTAIGAIPQLGFIHEHSGEAFPLDIADLFRDTILLPAAFQSARAVMDQPHLDIERHTRRTTGDILRKERVISKMIDRIKTLFQDVPPLEMGPDGPAGDWQAARDLDEADIYQAAVEEGTYQGSGGEASQGQGDAP